MNKRLTNYIFGYDFPGVTNNWYAQFADANSSLNASNSFYNVVTNQLRFVVVPKTNYTGPLSFIFYVSAFINRGDNSTNSGVITTNSLGRKEVSGSHLYTNSGDYPVYTTLQSKLGASATVPSSLTLTRLGTNNSVGWPAWAFPYQLLSNTNLTSTNWAAITNDASLAAYQNVVTNGMANSQLCFRLMK